MNHVSEKRIIKLAEDLSLTDVDEEMVILNLKTGSYYGVNHIGAELLKDVQKNTDFSKSVKRISEKYQVSQEQVASDIEQLLGELEDQELIVVEYS